MSGMAGGTTSAENNLLFVNLAKNKHVLIVALGGLFELYN